MLLEMQVLDFLPASHDSCSSPKPNIPPHRIKIPVVYNADVICLTRECGELVSLEVVIVVGHCVREATDDRLGDVYKTNRSVHYPE
jgi:hypothetical protein